MPINITGSKYNIRALTAAGTTSVTIGTNTFVSGDFLSTQRMVALFSSTNTFKGISWVRRFLSTTSLELENRFIDPVTGLFVSQVIGDQILISKNLNESTVSGMTVSLSNRTVITTDNVNFGTAGSEISCCVYDENLSIISGNSFGQVFGGVVVLGKLISYDGVSRESMKWARDCQIKPNGSVGTPEYNVLPTGGTSGHWFMFGGEVSGSLQTSYFIGAQTNNATNKTFAFFGTRLNYCCQSPTNGRTWASNPDRHLLWKTNHDAYYTNANLIQWGDGALFPASLQFTQYGAGTPLGILRTAITVNWGASSNNRTLVTDLTTGTLIDGLNSGTYNLTNFIFPSMSVSRIVGTVNVTVNFKDDYTNLKNNSTLVLRRTVDSVVTSSVVRTQNSTFTANVLQSNYTTTVNGVINPTNFYSSFDYTIKCYGYNVVSGNHSTYTYSLGTGGNGIDLKLGGLINQLIDTNVTLTETAALALSSKININSTTKTITISQDTTYDEIYDYSVAWGCASVANAVVPSLSRYLFIVIGDGIYSPTGWSLVVNNGVNLNEGTKFKLISVPTINLNTSGRISGVYSNSVGTSTSLELRNVSPESSYLVLNNINKNTILYGVNNDNIDKDYTIYFPPGSAGLEIMVAREKYGYERVSEIITLPTGNLWYTFVDVPDVGISEQQKSVVQNYTTIDNADKFYDRTAIFRLTEEGIKIGQITTREGNSIAVQPPFSVLINQNSTNSYSITDNIITLKAEGYANGVKYKNTTLTSPAIISSNSNEIISADFEDANGDSSLTILGGDGVFELWKIPSSSNTADYTTGVKLTNPTVPNIKFRFTGQSNFDIVGVDINSNVRRRTSMVKGNYTQSFYVGDQIQLAQAPQVLDIKNKVELLQVNIDAIKGSNFISNQDSLCKIKQNQIVMNEGIKKTSLSIPHVTNI